MSELELRNKAEIEAIQLTADEQKASDFEGKRKKWYHIKNNPYWLKKEFGSKVGRAVWVILITTLSFFFSSCAGSNFAVKQNELMKRGQSGQRQVVIKHRIKKWH
mgnify:CR=1 FL=1